jgi:hypothetical protein
MATNPIVKLYITSPTPIVSEGQVARFDIRAENLNSGTVVPYQIFGIGKDDLINTAQITGNVTFVATGITNESNANVTLSIAEDFVTEGQESIFLLLQPTFPYSLEISSTVSIQDTSINVDPIYNISVDKTTVIEGESVTFTLTTYNVPAGSVIPWGIVPVSGDITVSDFSNVTALTGYFPPTVSIGNANVASFILTTRDDFIFEQTETFYLTVLNNVASSQNIRIIDSGNTLITADNTFTGNITIKFLDKARLAANIGSIDVGKSFWDGTTGLLSEDMVLQGKLPYGNEDTLAFYHPFSYVIRSTKSIEEWRDSIKTLLHPAGLTIFSEINNETLPNSVLSLSPKSVEDSTTGVIDIVSVSNDISSSSNSFTVDSVTF